MSKYTSDWLRSVSAEDYAIHRQHGDIPGILIARDVFVVSEDGHISIKNPSKPYKGNALTN
jgi:hypothetical protein